MTENPYQSPDDATAARLFRPWRVLSVVAVFVALVAGLIGWQAMREKFARERARQNLQQLGQALEQYQARERSREKIAPPRKPD